MHKLLLFLLLLPLSLQAQHVYFGERDLNTPQTAIHFDKNGFPYPACFIADSTMEKAYGSLYIWFQQNNEAFITICSQYDYFPEAIDQSAIYNLRDRIVQSWVDTINTRSKGCPAVAFYVHGYRKSFKQQGSDFTSVTEFALLRENLKTYAKPQAFEVEVYWDGCYGCCFSSDRKKNKELFGFFEEACNNAPQVGMGLRPVLSGIETEHLQILSHSLGARIVTTALFNQHEQTDSLSTPSQHLVSVSLVAPAIAGIKAFDTFFDRHTNIDFKTRDNYRIQVVYNEKDFVLKKKDPKIGIFGPGTKKYGVTKLGCNHHNEAKKLQKYFSKNYPHSTFELVDKTNLDKCHSLRCYAKDKNLQEVSDFLWTP